MCGIAGYAGIRNRDKRFSLSYVLAQGIDGRGGHGAGFASMDQTGKMRLGRYNGRWTGVSRDFWRSLAINETCFMHARFATCGKKTKYEVHPFSIVRGNKPMLWGCHNGVIYSAEESAKKHKRQYTVDSKELFELLADEELEDIADLIGYGTIVWTENTDRSSILMCRMTDSADLEVSELKEGGVVFASTKSILDMAIDCIDYNEKFSFEPQRGTVYRVTHDGKIEETKRELSLSEFKYTYNADWEKTWWKDGEKYDDDLDCVETSPDTDKLLKNYTKAYKDRDWENDEEEAKAWEDYYATNYSNSNYGK